MKKLLFIILAVITFQSAYADEVIIVQPHRGRRREYREYREYDSDDYSSRRGFFAGFGVGAAGVHFGGISDDRGAFLGNLRIGGGVTNRLLMMGEFTSAVTSRNNVTTSISSFDFAVQMFGPGAVYFRPGIGFAVSRSASNTGATRTIVESNAGLSLTSGFGVEIRFGPWFALSPEFNLGYSRIDSNSNLSYGGLLGFIWYL